MSRSILSSQGGPHLGALVLLVGLVPGRALAHGFGQRYDLPMPLGLFAGAGAAVVILSFLAVFFVRPVHRTPPDAGAATSPRSHPTRATWLLVRLCRAVGFGVFVLVVAAGLLGDPDPFNNLAPVTVWIIGWVGLAFASALIGDVWRLIDPFDSGFRMIEAVCRTRRPPLTYRLETWPAVASLMIFAWSELVWPDRDVPDALAVALLAYTAFTWTGMWLFGRTTWRAHGELFTVVFGLLARFAPLAVHNGRLRLRWPGSGLLPHRPVSWSQTALVLLLLSTVAFDGLLETPLWADLSAGAQAWGWTGYTGLVTLALLCFPPLFGGLYLTVCWGMSVCARRAGASLGFSETARLFVLTLVPIAIAYHLAHYLSYFLIAGQFAIPLISDPFGWGWNLFGTKLYLIDLSVIDARTAWYVALCLIVTGHVIAVYLAHLVAERRLPHRAAMVSQIPMLALMIVYTASSLWILAQPITEPATV